MLTRRNFTSTIKKKNEKTIPTKTNIIIRVFFGSTDF